MCLYCVDSLNTCYKIFLLEYIVNIVSNVYIHWFNTIMELFSFGNCRHCFHENLVPRGGASVLCHCDLPSVTPSRKGSLGRDEDPWAVEEREEYYGSPERGLTVQGG